MKDRDRGTTSTPPDALAQNELSEQKTLTVKEIINKLGALGVGRAISVKIGEQVLAGHMLPAGYEDSKHTDDLAGTPATIAVIFLENGLAAITYFQVSTFYETNVPEAQIFTPEPLVVSAKLGSDVFPAIVNAFPRGDRFMVFRDDGSAGNRQTIWNGFERAARTNPEIRALGIPQSLGLPAPRQPRFP